MRYNERTAGCELRQWKLRQMSGSVTRRHQDWIYGIGFLNTEKCFLDMRF